MSWKSYRGEGPWSFVAQPNKWGYLNNPEWSTSDNQTTYNANPEDEPVVWPFVASTNKTQSNEGSEITTPMEPVWRIDKQQFGEAPISPTHIPCGYWTKYPAKDDTIIVPALQADTGRWRPTKPEFLSNVPPSMGNSFGYGQNAYIRFPSVKIPRGAILTSAKVIGTSVGDPTWPPPSGDVNLKIYFNYTDNAVSPTSIATAEALSLTQAVIWNTVPLFGTYGTAVEFPSVKDILQVVINRTGWVSGNSVMLVIRDNGSGWGNSRGLENWPAYVTLNPRLVINYFNYGY